MFVSVTTFCSSRNSMKHYFCLFFKSWKKPKLTYYTVAILFLQFFSSFCHALLMKMTVCKICNTLNNKYCSKICAHDFGKKTIRFKKRCKMTHFDSKFQTTFFSTYSVLFWPIFPKKKTLVFSLFDTMSLYIFFVSPPSTHKKLFLVFRFMKKMMMNLNKKHIVNYSSILDSIHCMYI